MIIIIILSLLLPKLRCVFESASFIQNVPKIQKPMCSFFTWSGVIVVIIQIKHTVLIGINYQRAPQTLKGNIQRVLKIIL